MKLRDLELPIVNQSWLGARMQDPWRILSEDARATWDRAAALLLPYQHGRNRRILRMLDALMLLTGTTLPAQITASNFAEFDQCLKQLTGALFSAHFSNSRPTNNRAAAHLLARVRRQIAEDIGAHCTWHIPVTRTSSSDLVPKLVSLVEALEIRSHLVNECRGWACVRKDGSIAYHRLTPFADKFGYEFANNLYNVCASYHLQRRSSACVGVDILGAYISAMEVPPSLEQLQNPQYTTELFSGVFEKWMTHSHSTGGDCSLEYLVYKWRGEISWLFNEHIFPSGLIAEPSGGLPSPRSISDQSREKHVKRAEKGEVYDKLLTQVPLEIGDDEAFELVFSSINAGLKNAKDWAWSEVTRKAEVLARRKQLAAIGTPRKVPPPGGLRRDQRGRTVVSAAEQLANAAATFEHLGYPCFSSDTALSSVLFPKPLRRWAEELALPSTGYLIPHCAVVVAEHPSVTSSFLENLELFDANGRMVGLVKTDTGHVLIGSKLRRGAKLATQEVHLNDRSFFALDQIIRITDPLRTFLREKDNDDWRYLLLSSAKGFGYPTRVLNLSSNTSTVSQLRALEASFARVLDLSAEEAKVTARRFSLSALRATAAVKVYFETRSVQAMAKALGHAEYDPHLLQRYLPAPIRMFFEERWVRIFQTGIIVEALVGSKYQVEASGFVSLDELHSFLEIHALRLPPTANSGLAKACDEGWDIGNLASHREAIFGLNAEILTTLLSLELAATNSERDMRPKAQYWAAISRDLIPYVERAALSRPDIQQFLVEARTRASPELVEGLAYE